MSDQNLPVKPAEIPPPPRELVNQERWLAKTFGSAHDIKTAGILTPEGILEVITPAIIMSGSSGKYPGFNNAPHRRADVLGETVGTKRKTALRQSAAAAAEALATALEVGDTTPHHVLTVVTDEDQVRYLDPYVLWDMLEKTSWWTKPTSIIRDFMAAILANLIEESLLGPGEQTYTAVVETVTTDLLTNSKSPEKLRKQLLDKVRELKEKVRDSHIVAIFSPVELVKFVPLTVLHKLLEQVAERYKWQKDETDIIRGDPLEDPDSTADGVALLQNLSPEEIATAAAEEEARRLQEAREAIERERLKRIAKGKKPDADDDIDLGEGDNQPAGTDGPAAAPDGSAAAQGDGEESEIKLEFPEGAGPNRTQVTTPAVAPATTAKVETPAHQPPPPPRRVTGPQQVVKTAGSPTGQQKPVTGKP